MKKSANTPLSKGAPFTAKNAELSPGTLWIWRDCGVCAERRTEAVKKSYGARNAPQYFATGAILRLVRCRHHTSPLVPKLQLGNWTIRGEWHANDGSQAGAWEPGENAFLPPEQAGDSVDPVSQAR